MIKRHLGEYRGRKKSTKTIDQYMNYQNKAMKCTLQKSMPLGLEKKKKSFF